MSESSAPEFGFPRSLRVRSRADFDLAFKRGKVIADGVLVYHVIARPGEPSRLGLSLSKRVGNAPLRNRWKRLIREAFRLNRHALPEGLVIVARPRKGARAEFAAIAASMRGLPRRLRR